MLFSYLLTSQNKHPALLVARVRATNTATMRGLVFRSALRAERIQTLNPNCSSAPLRHLCAPPARDMTLL
jgi:hypothetical protein